MPREGVRGNPRKTPTKRDLKMLSLLEVGWTLQSVASKFGVSRQRVHQIRNKWGISRVRRET
jgi:DNA-directed RNA polymerase sigma subunit (sigma70/sigma32)